MDAERDTGLMVTFLNTKSQHANPQILRTRLQSYMSMLQFTGRQVMMSVHIRSVTCVFCSGKVNFSVGGEVTLRCCQNKVCSVDCFKRYVYSATGSTLRNLDSVHCSYCKELIGKPMCLSYFTEWEIYTNSQAAQVQATVSAPGVFTCCVHMDEMPESERVRLACSHQICKECLTGHMEAKLEEGKSDLTCPTNGCSAEISESLVRQLTPRLFPRYEILNFEAAKSDLAHAEEILFSCPSVDCPNVVVAPVNLFDYTCTMCNNRYCPQCKYNVHTGQTCAEYFAFLQAEIKRKQMNSDADKATEEFFNGVSNRAYRQCPKCKVWIERMAGCKFMSCQSKTCQGKTYFCITCGLALEKDHGKHKCTVEGYDFL